MAAADEWETVPSKGGDEWETVGAAPGGDDPEVAFLKPGFKRGAAPPPAAPSVPDRIGRAAADYTANMGGLAGATNGQATAEHPMGRIQSSKALSGVAGGLQGATLGFADEIAGGLGAIGGTVTGQPGSFMDRYRNARDSARKAFDEAQADNPVSYGAGDVVGGLATAPLTFGGGAAKVGGSLAKTAGRAAVQGALTGAAQGLGASKADLTTGQTTDFQRAFTDAAASGIAGGITGGVLGGIGGKITRDAEKNATGWVVKDIIGEAKGASTPTARKQLADDAESAVRLMRGDKELDQAINKARHGGVDELRHAQEVINSRLNQTGSKLEPRWNEIDKQIGGGVRAGDLVQHLDSRIEDLRASGLTTDAAEADALEGIKNRISGARDWGAKTVNQLDAKAQEDLAALQKVRANVKDPATLKQIDDQIAAIQGTGKKVKTFDPETVVPARQIQKLWSDEAGIAYNSAGGINGTQAMTKKLDVASHLRDFRDQILEQASGGNPKVVAELRSINKDFSALKRMQKVIDMRVNSATANAGGASFGAHGHSILRKIAHGGGLTGAAVTAAMGHPLAAGAMLAAPLALGAKRALDRGVANALQVPDSIMARTIVSLMQRGIPQATAIQMARSAAPGGAVNDVIAPGGEEPMAETP